MSRDDLELWYYNTFGWDGNVVRDVWLINGYDYGLTDWITDEYEALTMMCEHLPNANAEALRRFVRAYHKGVEDRPVIVVGAIARPKLPGAKAQA